MGIVRFSIALICAQIVICIFMAWYMWGPNNNLDSQKASGSWKYSLNGKSFNNIPTKDVPWDSMNTIIFATGMNIYGDTGK